MIPRLPARGTIRTWVKSQWKLRPLPGHFSVAINRLDLATCQSGTFRGRTKLSKYGNARLRRTFWMATQVAIRQRDNSFRDKLGRYVAGHGNDPDRRRKAMTALTAKMARVAHAVIKTGTEYRPFVERADTRWKDPSLSCREGATATL